MEDCTIIEGQPLSVVTHFGCGTPGAASKTSLPPERQNGCIGGGMSPPDWG